MQNSRFETPITVRGSGASTSLTLYDASEASAFLLSGWPGKRSPKHRAALQACHDAISGDKTAMNARRAFIAAARESDVLVSEK